MRIETPETIKEKNINKYPPTIQKNYHLRRCFSNLHEKNLSELIIVTGRTGMGKSCTGLYIMLALDVVRNFSTPSGWGSRFSLDKCFWVASDFIEAVTKQKPNLKQYYPKGTCFLFDEVNIEASNLEFQSVKSKAVVAALQTNRKYNYCIIMTTPSLKSCAIGLRRLATAVIEMRKKIMIKGKPYALAVWKWHECDALTGQFIQKYERAFVPIIVDYDEFGKPIVEKRKQRYTSILIPLIPKKIEEEYNRLKDLALKRTREDVLKQMEYYKKFLGETGIKVQQYEFKDLQKLFLNEKGNIKWEEVLDKKGKIMRENVEGILYSYNDTIKQADIKKIVVWLKQKLRQAGSIQINIPEVEFKINPTPTPVNVAPTTQETQETQPIETPVFENIEAQENKTVTENNQTEKEKTEPQENALKTKFDFEKMTTEKKRKLLTKFLDFEKIKDEEKTGKLYFVDGEEEKPIITPKENLEELNMRTLGKLLREMSKKQEKTEENQEQS